MGLLLSNRFDAATVVLIKEEGGLLLGRGDQDRFTFNLTKIPDAFSLTLWSVWPFVRCVDREFGRDAGKIRIDRFDLSPGIIDNRMSWCSCSDRPLEGPSPFGLPSSAALSYSWLCVRLRFCARCCEGKISTIWFPAHCVMPSHALCSRRSSSALIPWSGGGTALPPHVP